jgi:hypothetical protein
MSFQCSKDGRHDEFQQQHWCQHIMVGVVYGWDVEALKSWASVWQSDVRLVWGRASGEVIFNGKSHLIEMDEALGTVKQWTINIELDRCISVWQLNEYIMGASNEKVSGESQIPAEALKRAQSPLKTTKMLLKLLQDFLTDKPALKKPSSHGRQQHQQRQTFLQ